MWLVSLDCNDLRVPFRPPPYKVWAKSSFLRRRGGVRTTKSSISCCLHFSFMMTLDEYRGRLLELFVTYETEQR